MPPRPLPDLPGVYYSIISGAAEGHPSNNTFAFEVTPPPATGAADVAAATAVANAIHTRWPTFCTGSMSQAYTASQVKTYPLHTPTAPAVVVPMTATGGRFGHRGDHGCCRGQAQRGPSRKGLPEPQLLLADRHHRQERGGDSDRWCLPDVAHRRLHRVHQRCRGGRSGRCRRLLPVRPNEQGHADPRSGRVHHLCERSRAAALDTAPQGPALTR